MTLEKIIESLASAANEINERFFASAEDERTSMRDELKKINRRLFAAHKSYERLWEIAHAKAAEAITVLPSGDVLARTYDPHFGVRVIKYPAADAAWLRDEAARRAALDKEIAKMAYAVWGVEAPVSITYFGNDEAARVTDGRRGLTIHLKNCPTKGG